jgi:hypothetical protein
MWIKLLRGIRKGLWRERGTSIVEGGLSFQPVIDVSLKKPSEPGIGVDEKMNSKTRMSLGERKCSWVDAGYKPREEAIDSNVPSLMEQRNQTP